MTPLQKKIIEDMTQVYMDALVAVNSGNLDTAREGLAKFNVSFSKLTAEFKGIIDSCEFYQTENRNLKLKVIELEGNINRASDALWGGEATNEFR